jgi:pyruvate carboxylase subunit B
MTVVSDEGEQEVVVRGTHVHLDGKGAALTPERTGEYSFIVNVDNKAVRVIAAGRNGEYSLLVNGKSVRLRIESERAKLLSRLRAGSVARAKDRDLAAPMPALVGRVLVSPGDPVKEGQGLVVLEAMKMENEIRAEGDGVVAEVLVRPGQTVEKGEILVRFS